MANTEFKYLGTVENYCSPVCVGVNRQINHPEEVNPEEVLPTSWLINLNEILLGLIC